jgi:hypothetical protein
MKKIFVIITLLTFSLSFAQQQKPEEIVQKQVEAYNNKDIEGFLNFYSDTVKIYNFPNQLEIDGKEAMRKNYTSFFNNAKILHCTITNRIVQNNKVIDQELVKFNDTQFSGVAIYEIENNKIVKVTFVN